jgi:hypothetical protein
MSPSGRARSTGPSPMDLVSRLWWTGADLATRVDEVAAPEGLGEPIVAEVVVLAGFCRRIAQLMRQSGTDVPAQPAE